MKKNKKLLMASAAKFRKNEKLAWADFSLTITFMADFIRKTGATEVMYNSYEHKVVALN